MSALPKRTSAMFSSWLLGEVARIYADLRALQLRLEIAEKISSDTGDTVHLRKRERRLVTTQLDVSRAVQELEDRTLWSRRCEALLRLRFTGLACSRQEPAAWKNELETSAPVQWFAPRSVDCHRTC